MHRQKNVLEPKKIKQLPFFASGCFWCTEHVFEAVAEQEAASGYSGEM
jgi:peptide-methionine (S)-S-oxide reductase